PTRQRPAPVRKASRLTAHLSVAELVCQCLPSTFALRWSLSSPPAPFWPAGNYVTSMVVGAIFAMLPRGYLPRACANWPTDLTTVADAALEVALGVALCHVARRFDLPVDGAGQPVACAVLAFGKHGGEELNYSSDIDLLFLYGEDEQPRAGRGPGADEFFSR